MQPIGIFGGTFDPIHHGHLRAAREAMRALALESVRFVPAANPPHRRAAQAAAHHRLAMVQRAIEGERGFLADDRELVRGGPSYTVLTLEELRAQHPAAPLCLLIGADAFVEFHTWHRWEEIPALAHLGVMRRPHAAVSADPRTWPEWARARAATDAAELAAARSGRVLFVAITPHDISATRIRERLAAGEPVDAEVPAAVLAYIRAHSLYRNPFPLPVQEQRH